MNDTARQTTDRTETFLTRQGETENMEEAIITDIRDDNQSNK